jgi:hypothetical protein
MSGLLLSVKAFSRTHARPSCSHALRSGSSPTFLRATCQPQTGGCAVDAAVTLPIQRTFFKPGSAA